MLFTICIYMGLSISTYGTIWKVLNLPLFAMIFIVFVVIFYILLLQLHKISDFINRNSQSSSLLNLFFQNNTKSFWLCFLFITVCHIPVIMAYFPGIFAYDSVFQIQFFLMPQHIEVHPVLHSLMVYGAYLLYHATNSGTLAIFTYTLFQQIIINLIFAYCILKIAEYSKSTLLSVFALLFFAIYPLNSIFPMIATKDVLFSGFVLLFTISLIDLFRQKNETRRKTEIIFIISALFMFLFRHNGIHAYILILPVLLFCMVKNRQKFGKALFLLLIPVFLLLGFNVIKSFAGIKPSPVASSVGILLQQMGRVRIIEQDKLSDDDKQLFRNLVSEKNELAYNPVFVDRMKINDYSLEEMQYSYHLENSIKNSRDEFINLYLKWFKLYPKDYIDAFLITNHNLWSLCAKPSDVVRIAPTASNLYILTFVADKMYGMPVGIKSYNKPLQVFCDKFIALYGFENNLFTLILFSIAVNTWLFLFCLIILLYERKYDIFAAFLLNFALLLTVLFAPVTLVRYVYQNFIIIPLLFTFCFCNPPEQTEQN